VIGDIVAVPTARGCAFGIIHGLRQGRRAEDSAAVEVQLLGELVDAPDGPLFCRGVTAYPPLEAPILAASAAEIAAIYARPRTAHLEIGSLRHDDALPACLATDHLLGKNFAILGSTGSGKSCAVTVILRSLLERHPFAHILVLDPHNEYAAAFGDRALRLDPSNLELPYWLLTFEEIAVVLTSSTEQRAYGEGVILRDAILRAKQIYRGDGQSHITVDTPVPYRLSDLARVIEDAMGTLNKPEGATAYRQILARLQSVREDRRYGFMFQSIYLRDNLDAILGRLLRLPVAGQPVTILDLSGVPSEVVNVVVSLLCRLIFEFALWSEREHSPPLLLVCEEAHRYVPADGTPVFEPTRRAIDRIAKEGRKYGVSLCLVSQRPSELSTSSLSQCGTIIALRTSNERDQQFVRKALPDGFDWLIAALPALATGEAVVAGEGVSVPMQIQFRQLAADEQPASQTPAFSRAWSREVTDHAFIHRTISRWRLQQQNGSLQEQNAQLQQQNIELQQQLAELQQQLAGAT
jgi:DNA helicase HerA-like ATPase